MSLAGLLVSDLPFCLIMEHKHPSVRAINSIVCSELQQRCFLLPQGRVILIVDHWSDDYKVYSNVPFCLYPTPQHSPCMKGTSDAITVEIQTHSCDSPLHFLFIVCGGTVGIGEQTQDKLLSQQGLKLKLISVAGFHSDSKHITFKISLWKDKCHINQPHRLFVDVICGTFLK